MWFQLFYSIVPLSAPISRAKRNIPFLYPLSSTSVIYFSLHYSRVVDKMCSERHVVLRSSSVSKDIPGKPKLKRTTNCNDAIDQLEWEWWRKNEEGKIVRRRRRSRRRASRRWNIFIVHKTRYRDKFTLEVYFHFCSPPFIFRVNKY